MIEPARIPAFFEPLRATVATGIPPGICKIDRMESQPSMALEYFTGTPRTGRVVSEATTRGRCAAPPAPAMMTFRPLPVALLAYPTIRMGVPCADTMVG